jgi:diguanylate cyclase (GGDEF)-like protein
MRTLQLAKMRKQREIRSLSAALRDPLTGLPGVALLADRYLDSVARCRRNNCGLALLHIDVDGFTAHEAAVGADLAEAQLIEIGSRLARDMRRTDVLARLDGATFLTLVDAMKHVSDAYVVARRLLGEMRRPFPEVASGVSLRLSIGVALRETEADDFDRHRSRAENAMYEARRQGGDRYAPAERQLIAAE